MNGLIEFAKIFAPYAPAMVAIVGVLLSAWLTQRNWARQFGMQRSVVVEERRVNLAEEVITKFLDADRFGADAVMYTRLNLSVSLAKATGREIPDATIQELAAKAHECNSRYQDAQSALARLALIVRLYFDNDIRVAFAQCLSTFGAYHDSPETNERCVKEIFDALHGADDPLAAISAVPAIVAKQLDPIGKTISAAVGELAVAFAEVLEQHS